MSANDILDVLNIQRDEHHQQQPPKKKQKTSNESTPKPPTGMARELYNLIGPNTPAINLSSTTTGIKDNRKFRPSPWTRVSFNPNKQSDKSVTLHHWVKGSKELLEQEELENKPYFFGKYNVNLDIPDLVDEETYDKFMNEIKEHEKRIQKEREAKELERLEIERKEKEQKDKELRRIEDEKAKQTKSDSTKKQDDAKDKQSNQDGSSNTEEIDKKKSDNEAPNEDKKQKDDETKERATKQPQPDDDTQDPKTKDQTLNKDSSVENNQESKNDSTDWTYEETKYLFELCKSFELKWPIIYDRYYYPSDRTCEDLKEQFYRICIKILESRETKSTGIIESLKAYSKSRELERKQYLENLLKRTPAEIAEEESLVIEARRFELAAKKMLMERSNLLTLLDSPQTTQNVSQYQSSQGLANLYNNLMIFDKYQKKKQMQQKSGSLANQEPVPPPIPMAASSSFKKDRGFQTHLQQYLSSLLKQHQHSNQAVKQEADAIQQLLMKRLTQKEEEAYGLYYHGAEKLTPGVGLRSAQRLPALQQKQSVLKSVNTLLQELDIPTGGGTTWKPVMPTRKTMSKYDELIRAVVTLLEVKRARDKLESEIRLIKSQRGLQ
ncbi:SWC4 [[Candida] subhashii]|uniref:SWR1-complex protein 4 n=1 Tax=[Candida] subhashii TaxID=561895 RepID=A0A8J5UYN4_9ASCO|nr:SWC4 [[Candida] subhashii]KAG7663214.1 SWC4 [[Candida] subhashii]